MAVLSDLYREGECPEVLWFVDIDVSGPTGSGISGLKFGTAYEFGPDIKRIETTNPVFDFRADFSRDATGVSAISFGIDENDYFLQRAVFNGYWEGRSASYYVGRRGWPASAYALAFTGIVDSINCTQHEATLRVRSRQPRLREAVRDSKYLGDNTDFEGQPGLTGNARPLAFGINSNVTPTLLDAGRLIFQYSQGVSQGALCVFDKAIKLTKGPDIAGTQTPYTISPPANGTFRDYPARSCFVLGAPPDETGDITVDFEGSTDYGGFTDTTAGIILQLLTKAGYSAADLDAATYANLLAQAPYRVGIVIQADETYESAINRLLSGIHANYGIGRDALFTFWLYRTVPSTCTITLNEDDIIANSIERGPNLPPIDTLIINGALNNTVQEEVALGATDEQAAFAGNQYRSVEESSAAMDAAFPDAEPLTIDTLLYGRNASANDLNLLATDLKPTFLGRRETFKCRVACQNFRINRGDNICVDVDEVDINRAPLYVERIQEFVGENETELTLSRTRPVF